jgi:hypothetical protein
MRLVRINGPGPGHRKTDKARRRREAAIERRKRWVKRQDRQAARKAKWERRNRIKHGLPLVDLSFEDWGVRSAWRSVGRANDETLFASSAVLDVWLNAKYRVAQLLLSAGETPKALRDGADGGGILAGAI